MVGLNTSFFFLKDFIHKKIKTLKNFKIKSKEHMKKKIPALTSINIIYITNLQGKLMEEVTIGALLYGWNQ